jgi:TPR repeat protein
MEQLELTYIRNKDFNSLKTLYENMSMTNPNGFYKLGKMYEHGIVCKRDYDTACDYYKQGVEKNHTECMISLAHIYSDRGDHEYAKGLYELAFNHGNDDGYYYLGLMYEFGEGVELDYNKALECYKKSVKSNDKCGLYSLVNLYKKCQDKFDKTDVVSYLESIGRIDLVKSIY